MSNIHYFQKKETNKKHCSQILRGVKKFPKYIFEDNLDTNMKDKRRFNGKTALEIVEEILGCQNDNIEERLVREYFDPKYGNNNEGLPDDPQMIFLLKKKRAQENEYKSHRATVINKNNNIQNNRYNPNYPNNQKNNNKEKQKEETIPLNEDEEQEIKANARIKRKLQENMKNNKKRKLLILTYIII